jgi:hypothetical protein
MSTNSDGLGVNQTHYYTAGDNLGRCPQCYGIQCATVGTMTVNGTAQDVNNCTNCNRLFTGANGGVQSLLQEAALRHNTQNVGFASSPFSLGQLSNQGAGSSLQYQPPDSSYKIDTTNNLLLTIQNEISLLKTEILKLANQNQELMVKLATDPLVNMRKRVSDFNLE